MKHIIIIGKLFR